jgi:carbon monoxide dehydrogenase subunit G
MPTVSSSIEIAVPEEPVWDLVSDPRRYPEWVVVTDRMLDVPSDGLRQGATYREYAGLKPFKSESEWLVTAFEPHRRQVHLGDDGAVEVELTIEIEPTDGGTRLTQTLEVRPRGMLGALMNVMWPLVMKRRLQRANDQTVANVKRLVGSGSLGSDTTERMPVPRDSPTDLGGVGERGHLG